MVSFNPCWQCITVSFLQVFLEKGFKAIDHWKYHRHFWKVSDFTLYFLQGHAYIKSCVLHNTITSISKLQCPQNHSLPSFLKKQFKLINHWQTWFTLWCTLHISQFLIQVLRTNLSERTKMSTMLRWPSCAAAFIALNHF